MSGVWLTIKAVGRSPNKVIADGLILRLQLMNLHGGIDFNSQEGLLTGKQRVRLSDLTLNVSDGSVEEPTGNDPVLGELRLHSTESPSSVRDTVTQLVDACEKLGVQLFSGDSPINRDGIDDFMLGYFIKP